MTRRDDQQAGDDEGGEDVAEADVRVAGRRDQVVVEKAPEEVPREDREAGLRHGATLPPR